MVYKRHCRLNQTRLRSDLQEHSTHGKVMPLPGQIKEDDDDEDETASGWTRKHGLAMSLR